MNGRCETDVIDDAIDVCETCGGEFCANCLVFPKGPKGAPYCKECAIASAGVRKSANKGRYQSKSEAKKRRKILRKQAAEGRSSNVVDSSELPDIAFEDPKQPKKGGFFKRRSTDPVEEVVEEETPEVQPVEPFDPAAAAAQNTTAHPSSASQMLEQVREGGSIESFVEPSENTDAWNMPSEIDPLEDPGNNSFDEVDPFTGEINTNSNPFATSAFPAPNQDIGPMFDDEPATTNYDAPAFEQAPAPQPAPEAQPAPAPQPAASYDAPAFEQAPAPQPSATAQPAAQPAPLKRPEPKPTEPAELLATPAPLVVPEAEVDPASIKQSRLKKAAKRMVKPAVPAVSPQEVAQPVVQEATEDTDSAGQWIPPNLRGMKPEAERGEVLPKRRRG